MSSHLLQKSLKLFEETDEYKKKRKRGLCFNFSFFFLSNLILYLCFRSQKNKKRTSQKEETIKKHSIR